MGDADEGIILHKKLRFGFADGVYLTGDRTHLLFGKHTNQAMMGFRESTSVYQLPESGSQSLYIDTNCDFITFDKPVESKNYVGIDGSFTRMTDKHLYFSSDHYLMSATDGVKHFGNAYFINNLGTERFSSGFAGYGWAILKNLTTTNDISFFKHFREVVHRDGTTSNQVAPLKKNIYSLAFLTDNLKAANKRYLEFISSFDNKEVGHERLEKITQAKEIKNRKYKGFNFFSDQDVQVLLTVLKGEFNINGLRNKDIQKALKLNGAKASRLLKRLWAHGIIKKIGNSYKYDVTKLGKETIITAQKIKELVLIPELCF